MIPWGTKGDAVMTIVGLQLLLLSVQLGSFVMAWHSLSYVALGLNLGIGLAPWLRKVTA